MASPVVNHRTHSERGDAQLRPALLTYREIAGDGKTRQMWIYGTGYQAVDKPPKGRLR